MYYIDFQNGCYKVVARIQIDNRIKSLMLTYCITVYSTTFNMNYEAINRYKYSILLKRGVQINDTLRSLINCAVTALRTVSQL